MQALLGARDALATPRGQGRVAAPAFYLGLGLGCIWMWQSRFLSQVSGPAIARTPRV